MTAGIVLAAGTSSRMGRTKQLLPFRGRPLLQHVVDVAATSLDEVVVVLGYAAAEIGSVLSLPSHARIEINPDYGSGQASSLRVGLLAVADRFPGAVVLLGDQPGIGGEAIRAVIETQLRTGAAIVRTTYRGMPGHPVYLDRSIWPEIMEASGDLGARAWIAKHPDRVEAVATSSPAPIEVDTEDDYQRLLESESSA